MPNLRPSLPEALPKQKIYPLSRARSFRSGYSAFLRHASGGNSQQRRVRRRATLRRVVPDATAVRVPQLSPLQQAWIEILSRSLWTYFVTLTWRPRGGSDWGRARAPKDWGPSEEVLKKAASRLLRRMHLALFHQDFREKIGLRYALAFERKRGRLHAHLLVAGGDVLQLALWKPWARWWQKNFGRIEFDKPRQAEAVKRYVSKYVTKDGDIDLCNTWDDEASRLRSFTPGAHERSAAPCKRCGLVSLCRCGQVNEDQIMLFETEDSPCSDEQARERDRARFNGPERDAGAIPEAPALQPEAATVGASLSPGNASASKTVLPVLSRRAARRRARYHRYMSRCSEHGAVVGNPAAPSDKKD